MRVTNSMLVSNYMNDLSSNMGRVSTLLQQMSSGRKFASISDDPVSLLYSLQARNNISRLAQSQRDLGTTETWLRSGETVVLEINELLQSAYETCIGAATSVKTDADRERMAEYIGQLRDHLLTAGNTTIGNKYIFGSFNTTGSEGISGQMNAPFTVDASGNILYNGLNMNDLTDPANLAALNGEKDQVLEFWVGTNIKMGATITGVELMGLGDDNAYTILDQLYNTLKDPNATVEDVQPFISRLQDKQSEMLSIAAEFGGKSNRVDLLKARYDQDEINYTQMMSDAEDVDLAEAIMRYSMAQAVYDASLQAGAHILQNTLLDFLR